MVIKTETKLVPGGGLERVAAMADAYDRCQELALIIASRLDPDQLGDDMAALLSEWIAIRDGAGLDFDKHKK